MTDSPHFTSKTFAFLRDLAANNRREWFQANRERYEEHVRAPALHLIAGFGPHLDRISPHFEADPRPVGGSLFRLHRDTRFARDKSPYKTTVGIQFRHEAGASAHAPGFYLHVAPGASFAGAGAWHPDGPALKRIRDAICADPAAWKRAAHGRRFRARLELGGDALARPPRGYDPEHPLVDDLRRKDFYGLAALDRKTVAGPHLTRELAAIYRAGAPLVGFLCKALGLPF